MGDPHEVIHEALSDTYELKDELGAGGMGTVYLARDRKHDRLIAIKVIHPDLTTGEALPRFEREIRVTAKLQHAHIVPLIDSGLAGGLTYYVSPFIEGESLRQRIRRRGVLPVAEAVRIASDVAEALDYAHGQGIVHRDVKPENILLSGDQAFVADFGLARAMSGGDQATLTATGSVVGTPLYISPEQLAGLPNIDARTDIYSLACVTYELLSGRPPFGGTTIVEILKGHIYETPEPLPTSIPAAVRDAVLQGLNKRPSERQSSAAEFAAALQSAEPIGSRRLPANYPWMLPAAAALVVFVLALAWRVCSG
jgi:serine/threonine-protein kinase